MRLGLRKWCGLDCLDAHPSAGLLVGVRSPDTSQVQQQHVLLDGDRGRRLGEVYGGVDASQVTRLQAVLPQQVSPLDAQAPHCTCLIKPQHLHGCRRIQLLG